MCRKIRILSIALITLTLITGCSLSELLANSNKYTEDSGNGNAVTQDLTEQTNGSAHQSVGLTEPLIIAAVQETFQGIYLKVNPSVVNIQVNKSYGWSTISGEGSGFVWDTQGHIVTNNHVVENANHIIVNFSDGSTALG